MAKCQKCDDNEQVLTLLAYALQDAEEKGYAMDHLTAGFVNHRISKTQQMTLNMLKMQQAKQKAVQARYPWWVEKLRGWLTL